MAKKKLAAGLSGGPKQVLLSIAFERDNARDAHLASKLELDELIRQENYSPRKYRALVKKTERLLVRRLELENIERNLKRIYSNNAPLVSKPTGRKGASLR